MLAVLALAGLASGCSGGDVAATGDLAGRTFLSVHVTQDGEALPLAGDSRIRLTFGEDSVSGSGGCNTIAGPAALERGRLVVADQLAMTEMACEPPELMEQDAWLAEFLTANPTAAVSGDELTLTSAGTAITLLDRAKADPDRPLVDTLWTLDSLVQGQQVNGTVSSVPQGVTSTLRIRADGRAELKPGCNTGMGSVDVTPAPDSTSEGRLVFGPISLTRMACPEPQMQVEQAVTQVLQGEVFYEIDGPVLRLYGQPASSPTGLVYRAANEGGD